VNCAPAQVVTASMGPGDDTVVNSAGVIVNGGDGNDSLSLAPPPGATNGGSLFGDAGDDTLVGSSLGDLLVGGDGNDKLAGGEGADMLKPGTGADAVDGGPGEDLVRYDDFTTPVNVNLGDPAPDADGDTITTVEDIGGGSAADQLTGDGGPNKIFGLAGDDKLTGADGPDSLIGDAGRDTFDAGGGDDTVNASAFAPESDSLGAGGIANDSADEQVGCGAGRDRVQQARDQLRDCETVVLTYPKVGVGGNSNATAELSNNPNRVKLARGIAQFALPCVSGISSRGLCKYRVKLRVGGRKVLDARKTVKRGASRTLSFKLRHGVPSSKDVRVSIVNSHLGVAAPFGEMSWLQHPPS
jgi:hypothetical protein